MHLPRSDGWLLKREIRGTTDHDAMGPYPRFFCHDWSALAADLTDLARDAVSVVLVTEPFASARHVDLERAFDSAIQFKDHFVAELDQPPEAFVTASHRARARRALRAVRVDLYEQPIQRLDDWVRLYATLVERHSITGLRAFSRDAFARQLSVPGLVMFRAMAGDEVVGLDLWYE